MGSLSIWHWVIVLAIIIILFGGKGKLSNILGDLGKGINNFKKEVGTESEEKENTEHSIINQDSSNPDAVNQNTESNKDEEKK